MTLSRLSCECKGCGVAIPRRSPGRSGRQKLRCAECARLQQAEWTRLWRVLNPDKIEQYRATRMAERHAAGAKPLSVALADKRTATVARAKKITALLAKNLSYSEAAAKLDMTKNAAIGVVDRARRHYGFRTEGV